MTSTLSAPQTEVLVVDDNLALGHLLRYQLEQAGYRVTLVSDPVEAWELLQAAPYDLLITDEQMPEMSGRELCRRLRETKRPTPVIMLTAKELEMDPEEVRHELGISWLLPKPFSVRGLIERIDEVLRAAGPGDADVPACSALPSP